MIKNKPLILIVDDSATMAKLTAKNVEGLGYNVEVRENSTRAISYVGNHKVDLILMDIELMDSRFDGIQTAKLIRTKYNIPVVFLTAHDDAKIFEEANIKTAFDVIVKPYDPKHLKMHIDVAIYNNNLEKAHREFELWYDKVIDSFHYGLVTIDNNSMIKSINAEALGISGYDKSTAIGGKLLDIFPISFDSDGDMYFPLLSFSELANNIETKQFVIDSNGIVIKCEIKITPVFKNPKEQLGYIIEIREK